MQTYDEMVDSGVEWLGRLPKNWGVNRVGMLFKQRNEKVSDKDYEPLSVTKKGIVPQLEDAAKTNDGDNRKKVLKGDFVINSRSDRKGSSGISPLDGSVSLINTVLTNGKLNSSYTHHLLRSQPFQEEFYRYGQGIVADLWSTNYQRMKSISLPVPPSVHQQKIADFLDTETAKIDNLIAKQERLLELLEEKRRATITHAVTRGLDPHVELKETNIPWLGQIPAHWNVNPLFKYVKENKRSNKGMVNENVLTLSYGKIKEKNLDNGGLMPESFETYQIVKPGDIILRLTDLQNDKTSLRVGHSSFEGIITSAYVDISSVSYKSKYLYYLLHAYDLMKIFYNLGAGLRQGMKFSDLKRLPAFGVEQDEQQQIIDYLESYERKTDELKQKIHTQITLLRERRTSLISHAVTGKVRI